MLTLSPGRHDGPVTLDKPLTLQGPGTAPVTGPADSAPLETRAPDPATEAVIDAHGRITASLEGFTPDFAYRIPDAEALPVIFDLLEHEGLCLGGSSGINVAGAIRMAREMGPGKTIVTCLCDPGSRYASKLFSPEFLRS